MQKNNHRIDLNYKVDASQKELRISFAKRLDMDSVAKIWNQCFAVLKKNNPKKLILDLKTVTYCDGAGIALIQQLKQYQNANKAICEIQNLKEDFQHLLEHIEKQTREIKPEGAHDERLPEHLGHFAVDVFENIRNTIVFLGMLSYQFLLVLSHPYKLRWRDFWRITGETGPKAFSIVALVGFLIGLISTFQAAPSFTQFGAQIFMVNLVGLGLVREMGPLLTAVLLAGRTASSFAAEIGTMKINQEIDALNTMSLNPIRFLVVPRILATMLVTVILEVFLILFGLVGCFVVMNTLGYTLDAFMHQLYSSVTPLDCIGGFIKVFVFGIVIAGVGCLHGFKTRFGAQAVGHSTTQAVVNSLIMLVIVDGVFATIYYVLGI